ncbi:MAG: carbohydrate kinase family protein [Patescibacteria group bacterium]
MLAHDDIAERQRKHFEDENIDTTFVIQVPGAQSHRSTVVSVGGERTILVYHAPRTYDFPKDLAPSKWVYLTSMAKGFESLLPDLAGYIKQMDAKLAFQPGTYQLRLGAEKTADILRQTEVILLNVQEAETYTRQAEGTSIAILCSSLHKLGPRIVVVTDSTKGSYASDGTTIWHLGTRPEIPRVEATGAGDAFSSAFVVALYEGQPIPEAMRWGTMNAESVIQKIGPQAGILTKTQLRDELARCPDFVAIPYLEDK